MAAPRPPIVSVKIPKPDHRAMLDKIRSLGLEERAVDYAYIGVKGPGVSVTFYRKGSLVIQGKAALTMADVLGVDVPEPEEPGADFEAGMTHHGKEVATWVGTDEVGKGDYFGPLVAVAALVTLDQVDVLAELGVKDSKKLTDKKITAIADDLVTFVPHEIVAIGPSSYNRMFTKMRNVNRMLAWAHARALENLLARDDVPPVELVVTDKFADAKVVERALFSAGRSVELLQRPKAEDDPAVATASLIARREFLKRMAWLSKKAGFTIPRGASDKVIGAGRRIVADKGQEALADFVKLHFRTTEAVLRG